MDLIGLSAAGTFDFTLEYALKEGMQDQVSDLNITLFYPGIQFTETGWTPDRGLYRQQP